ncbi:MAG: UDP-N-acetylmuramoyl-L-alanyl-D-glutamate--2,6-diaminopimelate ligase [Candidatus Aminicenantes bacterium]
MKLSEILNGVPVIEFSGSHEGEVLGISYDSRKIQPGYLFTAIKGEKTDGHSFIPKALESGAAAVLSDQKKPQAFSKTWIQTTDTREALGLCSANFYGHPSHRTKVVGITGTKGKTTITYILEEIIKQAQFCPGVIGTISYRGPDMDIPAERTTPEASDLHSMLQKMVDSGVTHCLMEVSSHSLELKRVTGIEFDLVVFTNLSGEHMDYHQDMDSYFEAKKKLFHSGQKNGMAVVNSDDEWGKKLIGELSMGFLTFGLKSPAMVVAEKFGFSEKGIELTIKHPEGSITVTSPLLGKPNVYNILASVASAFALNIPWTAIKKGIVSLQGVPGRFERLENSQGLHIYVDYAHTDVALKNLLETTRELANKRVILVFGAGGDRDKTKRSRMGQIAGALADLTILTSDNPRSEDPLAIIADIEQGILKTGPEKYLILPNRREAIKKALFLAQKDDTILVAGKGHEDYQIIGDKTIPFSDKKVILELLKEWEAN